MRKNPKYDAWYQRTASMRAIGDAGRAAVLSAFEVTKSLVPVLVDDERKRDTLGAMLGERAQLAADEFVRLNRAIINGSDLEPPYFLPEKNGAK